MWIRGLAQTGQLLSPLCCFLFPFPFFRGGAAVLVAFCAQTALAEPEGETVATSAQETGLRMFNLRLPDAAAARAALESFQGPPWLREAVAAWRQQHPEALETGIDTLQSDEGDIALWLEEHLGGSPGSGAKARASAAKSGEGEGEGEGSPAEGEGEGEDLGDGICPFLMTGYQVEPPSGSPATCLARLTIGPGYALTLDIEHDVANPTALHAHNAEDVVVLDLGAAASPFHHEFTTAEIDTMIAYGVDYLDIHSTAHPDGDVRGAPLCDDLVACEVALTGDQVQPPSGSAATGVAGFVLDPATMGLLMQVEHTATGATAFHIHAENDGETLSFANPPNPMLHVFTPDEMAALWCSGAFEYVDLHTDPQTYPDGELRSTPVCDEGGMDVVVCPMTLTGDQMYPASGCADVAEAVLVFNPATMYLRFHIEHPFTAPE
ncbi:MAG: CHRD domain-containing protein, partial [Candidatus Hydrogenedentes bacterium]|nr:CHRD domain-containing protein [Candidatus Hydrogenedentota bacterium]